VIRLSIEKVDNFFALLIFERKVVIGLVYPMFTVGISKKSAIYEYLRQRMVSGILTDLAFERILAAFEGLPIQRTSKQRLECTAEPINPKEIMQLVLEKKSPLIKALTKMAIDVEYYQFDRQVVIILYRVVNALIKKGT